MEQMVSLKKHIEICKVMDKIHCISVSVKPHSLTGNPHSYLTNHKYFELANVQNNKHFELSSVIQISRMSNASTTFLF